MSHGSPSMEKTSMSPGAHQLQIVHSSSDSGESTVEGIWCQWHRWGVTLRCLVAEKSARIRGQEQPSQEDWWRQTTGNEAEDWK
jgi:hypothetical protein